jgi:hypothetical protein
VSREAPSILGRYAPPAGDREVTVVLLNFPLQVFASARQHHDELLREFALLALRPPEDRPGHNVPARLLDLIEAFGNRYGGAGDRADKLRDEALSRGQACVDLTYRVPHSVGPAMRDLHDLMEAADSFCRDEQLLTLAATPTEKRFRAWFTMQFTTQALGAAPTPWDGPMGPDTDVV